MLPTIHFLYFIHKDVVVFPFDKMFVNVIAQMLLVGDESELTFFFVDVDDIGVFVLLMSTHKIFQYIALAHTSLPCEHNDDFFP